MNKFFLSFFRLVAILEGISFIALLFIAMPLKYIYDLPQFVKVLGMAHGLLFVIYILQVVMARVELNWSIRTSLLLVLASVLPFGTFYADRKYLRQMKDGVEL